MDLDYAEKTCDKLAYVADKCPKMRRPTDDRLSDSVGIAYRNGTSFFNKPGRWYIGLKRCDNEATATCSYDLSGQVFRTSNFCRHTATPPIFFFSEGRCLPGLQLLSINEVANAVKCGGATQPDTGQEKKNSATFFIAPTR